jgi:predicted component of type VI protein secretion system
MWITISTGQRASAPMRVTPGAHVLGRARDCHVVVDDPRVSSRHARLDVAEGGAWLVDLRSTNGTFVDGRRLQPDAPVWLVGPSEFQLGVTTVRLTVDEPTVHSGTPPSPTLSPAGAPPAWAAPATPAPPVSYVAGAGPVAGGDVSIRAGRDAAGRDLIILVVFKMSTMMWS